MKTFIVLVAIIVTTLATSVVPVQAISESDKGLQAGFGEAAGIASRSGLSSKTPAAFIQFFINVGLSFVGIIATAVIIYGGVLYITSAGDDSKIQRAKTLLLYAVIGLLLVGAAAIIVNVIIDPTGSGSIGGGGGDSGGDSGGSPGGE